MDENKINKSIVVWVTENGDTHHDIGDVVVISDKTVRYAIILLPQFIDGKE